MVKVITAVLVLGVAAVCNAGEPKGNSLQPLGRKAFDTCDLPMYSAIRRGTKFHISKVRIPQQWHPIFEQIVQKSKPLKNPSGKQRLLVVDLGKRGGAPASAEGHAGDLDFLRALHGWMRHEKALNQMDVIGPLMDGSFDQYGYPNFCRRAFQTEANGEPLLRNERGPSLLIVSDPLRTFLNGKGIDVAELNRKLGGAVEIVRIDNLPDRPAKPVFSDWTRHVLNADTTQFEHLLKHVAANPDRKLTIGYRGEVPRLRNPLREGEEFTIPDDRRPAYELAMRLLQGQLIGSYSVLLAGPLQTGKTTLMHVFGQLLHQTQYQIGYRQYARHERFAVAGYHPDNMTHELIDQVDHAGDNFELVRNGRLDLPVAHVMTSNELSPSSLKRIANVRWLDPNSRIEAPEPETLEQFNTQAFGVNGDGFGEKEEAAPVAAGVVLGERWGEIESVF